jgi:hypothetical protein
MKWQIGTSIITIPKTISIDKKIILQEHIQLHLVLLGLLVWNNHFIGNNLSLYINKTKTQIGGIRYCKNKDLFFGLEADPISKKNGTCTVDGFVGL